MKRSAAFITVILAFMTLTHQTLHAKDKFLYGVQIFNRPIDWTSPFDTSAQSAGTERVRKLLDYAASLDVDLVRGGTTFDNISNHAGENNNAGVLRGMNSLLPMLAQRGLILDWVLNGTAERDADYSAISPSRPDTGTYTIPPRLSSWAGLLGTAARTAVNHNANVLYEVWNEPDLNTGEFWRGTREHYYNDLLPEAVRAIHAVNPNARILNGGLVLGRSDTEAREYLSSAINELKAGRISMLALHAHDPFIGLGGIVIFHLGGD